MFDSIDLSCCGYCGQPVPLAGICGCQDEGFRRVVGKMEKKRLRKRSSAELYAIRFHETLVHEYEEEIKDNIARIEELQDMKDRVTKCDRSQAAKEECSAARRITTNDTTVYEEKWYCQAVRFYKTPVLLPRDHDRLCNLFQFIGKGKYDAYIVREAFRDVNEVLYELQWFSKIEVCSLTKSNKYLKAFFRSGKQLTNLKASKVTENFRKNDAMIYWMQNYKMFLRMFCGLRENVMTRRLDKYFSEPLVDRKDFVPVEGLVARRKVKTSKVVDTFLGERPDGREFAHPRKLGKIIPEAQMHGRPMKYVDRPVPVIVEQGPHPFSAVEVDSVPVLGADIPHDNWWSPSGFVKRKVEEGKDAMAETLWDVLSRFISQIPSKTSDFFSSVFSSGKDIVVGICRFLKDMFDNLVSCLSSVVESISGWSVPLVFMSCMCLLIFFLLLWYMRARFVTLQGVFSLAILRVLDTLGFNYDRDQANRIREIFADLPEAQSLSCLAPLLGVAMAIGIGNTDRNTSQSASAALNFASRLPDVVVKLEDALKECFDWCYYRMYGEHILKDKCVVDEFDEFINDFYAFNEIVNLDARIVSDLSVGEKLVALKKRVDVLEPLFLSMRINKPALTAALGKAFSRVRTLMQTLQTTSDYILTRIETVCLWLYGESGQGKTTVIEHIVAAVYENMRVLYPTLFLSEFTKANMFYRTKNTDFWEGYDKQFVVVWNEILEKTDPLERAKVASELLTACEDGTFPLNMAFGLKGRVFFGSYLAVVTSNISEEEIEGACGMTSPNALVRRRTLYLQVIRDQDFSLAKGNFNESWRFVLRRPTIESFARAFEQGTPKEIFDSMEGKKMVELRFSDVVNILTKEMEKRLVRRQATTSFMRGFNYVEYCKKESSVKEVDEPEYKAPALPQRVRFFGKTQPQKVRTARSRKTSPLPAPRSNELPLTKRAFVRSKPIIVDDNHYDDERSERDRAVEDYEPGVRPGETPMDTTTQIPEAQMWAVNLFVDKIVPDSVSSVVNTICFGASNAAFKVVNSIEHVVEDYDRIQELRSETHFADGVFLSHSQSELTSRLSGLSDEDKSTFYCCLKDLPPYFIQFAQLFLDYALTSSAKIRKRCRTLLRIIYLGVYFERDEYIQVYMHRKRYGIKKSYLSVLIASLRDESSRVTLHSSTSGMNEHHPIRMLVNLIVLPNTYDVFNGMLSPFVSDLIIQSTIVTEHDYNTPGEKIISTCKAYEARKNPDIFKPEHWMLKATSLRARWNTYMEERLTPFFWKNSAILFGVLASVIGASLAVYFCTKPNDVPVPQKEYKEKSESVGRYTKDIPRSPLKNFSESRGHQTTLTRSTVSAQSVDRGHNTRLTKDSVSGHSLPRGMNATLSRTAVSAQSSYSVPGRWDELLYHSRDWLMALVTSTFRWNEFQSEFMSICGKCLPPELLQAAEGFYDSLRFDSEEGLVTIFDVACVLFGVDMHDQNELYNEFDNRRVHSYLKGNSYVRTKLASEMIDLELSFVRQLNLSEGQSGVDDQISNVSHFMRELAITYEHGTYTTKCIVSGLRAITVNHFFQEFGLGFSRISIINNGVVMATTFASNVTVSPLKGRRDLMAVDFHPGMSISPMRDLRSKLYSDPEDMSKNMQVDGYFSRLHKSIMKDGTVIIHRQSQAHVQQGVTPLTQLRFQQKVLDVDHAFYYYMMHGLGNPGDCAEPYTQVDSTNVVRVIGIHTGRNGEDSIFAPIFKEDFDNQPTFAHCYIPKYMKGIQMPQVSGKVHNGKFCYEGKAPKFSFIPKDTRFVASPAQGSLNREQVYPVNTAPALLCPTMVETAQEKYMVYPLDNALKKLGASPARAVQSWMKSFVLSYPERAFEGFFPTQMDFKNIRPWTIEEVLFGIPGVWAGLPRDTAKGYDMDICLPACKSRKEIWDPETGFIHPILKLLVKDLEDAVARGECPKNVVAGCLKDETRDLPRVNAGKTRLFCVGSLSHLVWTVKWMGALVTEMKRHRGTSDVAIGTDIHSADWKYIFAKIFDQHQELAGGGDFGNYDTSINLWFGKFLGDACAPYYRFPRGSLEDNMIRAVCLSALAPLLVITESVYWMDYFNSSGGWLTGFLNSFVNICIFNFIIFKIQGNDEDDEFALARRSELLPLIVYGDDNMWTWYAKYADKFNMQILAKEIYELFGMDYTTPSKEAISTPFLEPKDIEFLCRKFKVEGGSVKAPLSEDSIHSMINWIKKPSKTAEKRVSLAEQYQVNIETACQEWFHYGKERFVMESECLMAHCREVGIPFPGKEYQHYALRWLQAQTVD